MGTLHSRLLIGKVGSSPWRSRRREIAAGYRVVRSGGGSGAVRRLKPLANPLHGLLDLARDSSTHLLRGVLEIRAPVIETHRPAVGLVGGHAELAGDLPPVRRAGQENEQRGHQGGARGGTELEPRKPQPDPEAGPGTGLPRRSGGP